MASSMAGSMAGSMLGNALMGSGRSSEPAPAQVAAPAPGGYGGVPSGGPVCMFETRQFLECMSNTADDMSQCSQFYDAFKQCNSQVAM